MSLTLRDRKKIKNHKIVKYIMDKETIALEKWQSYLATRQQHLKQSLERDKISTLTN